MSKATAKCTILSWDTKETKAGRPIVEIVAKDDVTEVVFTVSYMIFGDAETISYDQLGALLGAASKHEIFDKIDNLVGLACCYGSKNNGEYENFALYPLGRGFGRPSKKFTKQWFLDRLKDDDAAPIPKAPLGGDEPPF